MISKKYYLIFIVFIITSSVIANANAIAELFNKENNIELQLTNTIKPILERKENISISNSKGTFVGWVKLNESNKSKTLMSARWDGDDTNSSYMVISDGWWEQSVAKGFYFVIDNKQNSFCYIDNYSLTTNKWNFIAVNWGTIGLRNVCQIYINGQLFVENNISVKKNKKTEVLSSFSDDLTDNPNSRIPAGLTSGFVYIPSMLDWKSILKLYETTKTKYSENINVSIEEKKNTSVFPNFKERVLFDEDIYWALSKKNTDEVLSKVQLGNFNVFIPCVWHGNGTYFKNSRKLYDPLVRTRIEEGDDPLDYLLKEAKKKGIQVIPWFTVAYHDSKFLSEFADSGIDGAYNIHNQLFREFISSLIGEAIIEYKLEAVNIDYIRSIGVCMTEKCQNEFKAEYGKNLQAEFYKSKISYLLSDTISEWNRKSVEDILKNIRTITSDVGFVKITVDAVPLNKELQFQGQESIEWLNNGLVDVVFSMNYQRNIDVKKMIDIEQKVKRGKVIPIISSYDLNANNVVPRSPEGMVEMVELINRNLGSDGIAIYHRKTLSDMQMLLLNNKKY